MIYLGHLKPVAPAEFGEKLEKGAESYNSWKALNEAREAVKKLADAGIDIKGENFVEGLWKKYKGHFKKAQKGKCCYCEQRIAGTQYGDLEHFRPKAEVHRLVKVTGGKLKKVPVHKNGYWWLAYSWNNWLYSCLVCNQKYKVAQFPVEKECPLLPGVENQEQPLIIQPYLIDPTAHLSFLETGEIQGLTLVGKESVRVYGLDREELSDERADVAAKMTRLLDDLKVYVSNGYDEAITNCIRDIDIAMDDKSPFAGMCRALAAGNSHYQDVTALFSGTPGVSPIQVGR